MILRKKAKGLGAKSWFLRTIFLLFLLTAVSGLTEDESEDDEISPENFPNYVEYVKSLLIKDRSLLELSELMPCVDLDPTKEYAVDLNPNSTETVVRICDLCSRLPFMTKLSNTMLDVEAGFRMEDTDLPECIATCIENSTCVAFSFDTVDKVCYLMNNTDGELLQWKGFVTGITKQPIAFVHDWFYQRNTEFRGRANETEISRKETLFECIQACDEIRYTCVGASYDFQSKNCSLFFYDPPQAAVLRYGTVAVFHADFYRPGDDPRWRFVEEESDEKSLNEKFQSHRTSISASLADQESCPRNSIPGFRSVFNPVCKMEPLAGCDRFTGCQACYYPEIVEEINATLGLPICKDSFLSATHQKEQEDAAQRLEESFKKCLATELCLGVDVEEETQSGNLLMAQDLKEVAPGSSRYLVAFPDRQHGGFISMFQHQSRGRVEGKPLTGINKLEWCMSACSDEGCGKFSFDREKGECLLGGYADGYNPEVENDQIMTFLKNPSITSPAISFNRLPGLQVDYPYFGFQRELSLCPGWWCSREDLEVAVKEAMDQCLAACTHCFTVTMTVQKYGRAKLICQGITSRVPMENIQLIENPNANTYIRKGFGASPSLDDLDAVSLIRTEDMSSCFESSREVEEQSLTTLAEKSHSTSEVATIPSTAVKVRVKRGWGWVKKAVKSVGNAIKTVGKAVVDTAIDAGKTIVATGKATVKVFRGDFAGALDTIKEAPIVKDAIDSVKTVAKMTKAIVEGDWDAVKRNALDFALTVAEVVPIPGGKAFSKIGKKLTKKLKNLKKRIKKKMRRSRDGFDKVGRRGRRNRKRRKKKDRDIDGNSCPRRQKRAGSKKRPRPGQRCKRKDNDDDDPKKWCRRLTIKNSLKSCRKSRKGRRCYHECDPGYDEEPNTANCRKGTQLRWTPIPRCNLMKCPSTHFSLLPMNARSRITHSVVNVYTVLLDTRRKLPVWSVQYVTALNALLSLDRKSSFYKHPCPNLRGKQGDDGDYDKRWHRGHLSPAYIARFSEKAARISNFHINIAPQDPYSNMGPWKTLELHLAQFCNKMSMLISTGVCESSLPQKTKPNGLAIPSCFWKMVCYHSSGRTIVVGFHYDNTKASTAEEKKARKDQISTAVSQAQILAKMGPTYSTLNPWLMSSTSVFKGSRDIPGIGVPTVNPAGCAAAMTLPNAEKAAWETALRPKRVSKKRKRKRPSRRKRRSVLKRGCQGNAARQMALLMGLPSLDMDEIDDFLDRNPDKFNDDSADPGGKIVPNVNSRSCNKRVIGYFTSWGDREFTFSQASLLTHLVFAFLEMRPDGILLVGSADPGNSKDRNAESEKAERRLQQVMDVAEMAPHLKVMFAVGGWANSQYFSKVAADPELRLNFIASTLELIDSYGFDGIDVDWEYPVTGGAQEGVPNDRNNYILLMLELRAALTEHQQATGREEQFYISFAGAAGQWTLDPGYDLPALLKYADWANVMTYDFFGAWESKWGAYTGPPAPLYFAMPPRFSGKTNVDFTLKYYACRLKNSHQITMGIPFYGRFWENVGGAIDPADPMWRTARQVGGKFVGGYVSWRDIASGWAESRGLTKSYHEKAEAPYAVNSASGIYLGYENHRSVKAKLKYAKEKNLGGVMVWAIDQDDDQDSMLTQLAEANLCGGGDPKDIKYKCSPITGKRWWTWDESETKAGLCGRSAPLYKGYYPVCDPDDPGYSCCGKWGYCGNGEAACDCPECKNYREDPSKILDKPIKPTVPVSWYFLDTENGKRGRCGRGIPLLKGKIPTCNPDDENAHCCSNGNYCGTGDDFCKCETCVDFKKNPKYQFPTKTWWEWADGPDKSGRCSPTAPQLPGGKEAGCNPDSPSYHCCSPSGWCGSGRDFCDCPGCKNYKKN